MSQAFAYPFPRTDRSPAAIWWWTLDQVTLYLVLTLLLLGFFFSFSSSPIAANAVNIADDTYFTKRHFIFAIASAGLTVVISMLSLKGVRRVSFVIFCLAIAVMAALPFMGYAAKGGQRWLDLGLFSLQPSEFLKPVLIVLVAWMFSEGKKGALPGVTLAFCLYGMSIFLLLIQPDVGQSILITVTFGACFFISGVPFRWILFLSGGAGIGLVTLYYVQPHFRNRIVEFFAADGDRYQVDSAKAAIAHGGLFGQGLNEGTLKRFIPDLHTDFIYSVVAEEYGFLFCLLIIGIFAYIVSRGLAKALAMQDPFRQIATSGLSLLIGLQVLINISVNLGVIPPKGMTLPFISYGGSSLMAMGLTMGLLLALTRKRPETVPADDPSKW